MTSISDLSGSLDLTSRCSGLAPVGSPSYYRSFALHCANLSVWSLRLAWDERTLSANSLLATTAPDTLGVPTP